MIPLEEQDLDIAAGSDFAEPWLTSFVRGLV
jgi:hypothetical protein